MSNELNPCPWCGEIPDHYEGMPDPLRRYDSIWRIAHECNTEAGLRIETLYYRTKDEAADAWNRRAKDAIVRCRDCEHSRNDGTFCAFFAAWYTIAGGNEYQEMPADVEPDGFCKWGKPRKEQS